MGGVSEFPNWGNSFSKPLTVLLEGQKSCWFPVLVCSESGSVHSLGKEMKKSECISGKSASLLGGLELVGHQQAETGLQPYRKGNPIFPVLQGWTDREDDESTL